MEVYIKVLIERIENGENQLSDFPQFIQELITEQQSKDTV